MYVYMLVYIVKLSNYRVLGNLGFAKRQVIVCSYVNIMYFFVFIYMYMYIITCVCCLLYKYTCI
jgi:hypothetical protein